MKGLSMNFVFKTCAVFFLFVFFSSFSYSQTPFKDCIKSGQPATQCYKVGGGYNDCIKDKQPQSLCNQAQSGYKDCRADNLSASQCISVNGNYKECRETQSISYCLSFTAN